MTLIEFISPLKNRPHRDRVLAILYFRERYGNKESLTVEGICQGLKAARIKNSSRINVADVLTRSGHYVDSPGTEGTRRLWKLTNSGREYIRDLLGLPKAEPEIEHDVGALSSIVATIKYPDIRDYVEESITCLKVGALRAAVVFLWVGAIRVIQNQLLVHGSSKLTTALKKHDTKSHTVATLDHFAYIKDKITLLAALELGLLDKNQKDTLEEALGLRNRCGHPSRYKPGIKKVSSFVEDIVSIVFR